MAGNFPLAIDGLGRLQIGSALLIMGIAGGAIIPQVYRRLVIVMVFAWKTAFFWCVLPCYLYIFFYAWLVTVWGSTTRINVHQSVR